jgi:hypothetical protein
VATQSEAWTVFTRSNTEIVASNPTGGMDVCVRLFCIYVVLFVGNDLATVYRIRKTEKEGRHNKRAVELNKER